MDKKINAVYEIYKGLKLCVFRGPCLGKIVICLQQGIIRVYLTPAELAEIFTLLKTWRDSQYESAQINNLWCTQIKIDQTKSPDKALVLEYEMTPLGFGAIPGAHISIYNKKLDDEVFCKTPFTIRLNDKYSIEQFIDMCIIVTKKQEEMIVIDNEIERGKSIFRHIFQEFDRSPNNEPHDIVRQFMGLNHTQKFVDLYNDRVTVGAPNNITEASEMYQYLTTKGLSDIENDLLLFFNFI